MKAETNVAKGQIFANMNVQLATEKDILKIIPTMQELRPHLSAEEMTAMIIPMFEEGYQVAFIGDEELAYSVAGFRTITFLYSGKTLYIDDLVTHRDHKKKGYAGMLLTWLKKYALEHGYDHFSLDSGFQRKDAHRLYLDHGLELEAFHFGIKMNVLKERNKI
jgi:GNAT superfamily N-acetyltransferase